MNLLVLSALLTTCLAEFIEISSYSSLDSIDVPLPSVLSDSFGLKSRQPISQSSYSSISSSPEAEEVINTPPSASFTGASFLHYIPESNVVLLNPSNLVAVKVIEPTDSIFPPALKASPQEVSRFESEDESPKKSFLIPHASLSFPQDRKSLLPNKPSLVSHTRFTFPEDHKSSLPKTSSLALRDSFFFPILTRSSLAKESSLSSLTPHDTYSFPTTTKSPPTKLSASASYDGFLIPPAISSSPKPPSLTQHEDFIFPPLNKPPSKSSLLDESSFSSSSSYDPFSNKPFVPILQDNRLHEDDGSYSFSLHTGDGVKRQEKGVPIHTKEGKATAITGSYSYTLPDGQLFEVHYTADENGFQPQSNYVPIAPAFPHPIPPHAREQIERGRREHLARELRDRQKEKRHQQVVSSYAVPSTDIELPSVYAIPF